MKPSIEHGTINHVALVLDASSSVASLSAEIIKVVDAETTKLARLSTELDQETRITVYLFADDVRCLIYDKDVLRLPSIAKLYSAYGNTALIDGTMTALNDLRLTPTKYGHHSFICYTMTDGEENHSRTFTARDLQDRLTTLPEDWVAACFVPNQRGVLFATKFGFPRGSVEIWDATSSSGVDGMGQVISRTTERFMRADITTRRAASRNGVFTMDVDNLSPATVKRNLTPLNPGQYRMYDVTQDRPIAAFVESATGVAYRIGSAYYHLTKTEEVQAQKQVCVYDRRDHKVYTGPAARDLLGLPNYMVRVHPNDHPNYDVFVQSTSVNRKLVPGTKLLLLS